MATQKVLMLSPYGDALARAFTGDDQVEWRSEQNLTEDDIGLYDWVVCYGYRKPIRDPLISTYRGQLLNLHLSYLPFNRGADPNFWSWFDNTEKGVSIHEVDHGQHTGRLLAQSRLSFNAPEKHTLATSYSQLQQAAVTLFEAVWPSIRRGAIRSWPQEGRGTYHSEGAMKPLFELLPDGWNTRVEHVEAMGHATRKYEA